MCYRDGKLYIFRNYSACMLLKITQISKNSHRNFRRVLKIYCYENADYLFLPFRLVQSCEEEYELIRQIAFNK